MRVAALLLLIACEKSGPVESTPGAVESSPAAPVATPKVAAAADAAVATLPKDAAPVAKTPDDAPSPTGVAARPMPKLDDEADAFANMITADGGRDNGDMSKRPPGGDLAAQIKAVREADRSVPIGNAAGRATGPAPEGRITVAASQAFDDSSLKPAAVVAKINAAYMAAIKRCYKDGLKRDRTLRGKLLLQFTVNEDGRVVQPTAKGSSTEVDRCIASTMASWRFPPPKDVDRDPTDAAFSITLQLTPE